MKQRIGKICLEVFVLLLEYFEFELGLTSPGKFKPLRGLSRRGNCSEYQSPLTKKSGAAFLLVKTAERPKMELCWRHHPFG